jgi:cellulose biosynthesis protein BcsQ
MPVTIAVTGAKGGIGKSTTTVNLAVSFARKYPGQVVLIDFYGQYGNVPADARHAPELQHRRAGRVRRRT